MKTYLSILILALSCQFNFQSYAQAPDEQQPEPAPAADANAPGEVAPAPDEPTPPVKTDDKAKQPAPPPATSATVATNAPDSGAFMPPATASSTNNAKGLRLNFRGVPLDMVLNYMSDAAGFIIVLETEVKGKVDVWSNQLLTKDEAVDLLNTVLNQNGYAAIQKGRTLHIVSREDAKTRDIEVKKGNIPEEIPKTDRMVTQVVPVRYVSAAQLIKDLEPLLPSYSKLTANESGNSLVITDTQSNIRRMVEIVKALDAFPGISKIRVFPLVYADSKDLASAVKDLFAPPATGNQGGGGGGGGRNFFNPFGGGGGGGPGGGGRGGRGGNTPVEGAGATQNSKVTAVSDERTNSLVVSAPEDVMSTIEDLVRQIDISASDVTELRVFHLLNADPLEVTSMFEELFPDDSKSNEQNQNNGFRFGGGRFGFGGGGNRNAQTTGASTRALKKQRVTAVADQRTSSIIVSAAAEMMPQIAQIIERLDASSGKKQRVYIYNIENADVAQVEQVVRDMFQRSASTGNRSTANKTSALETRTQQQQQQNASASRTSGFGSGLGASGGSGIQGFR